MKSNSLEGERREREMEILKGIAAICATGAVVTLIANFIMVLVFDMDELDKPVVVTMILPWIFILIGYICIAIKISRFG